MRVGLFRRLTSFAIDVMPIIFIISMLFTLFVEDVLKPEGYEEALTEYQEIYDQYFGAVEQRYSDEEITYDEFVAEVTAIQPSFNFASRSQLAVTQLFVIRTVLYYTLSFVGIYMIYILATKGQSYGRKLMRIEVGGKVTRWRVFIRDVVWKIGYWLFVFYIAAAIFWSSYLIAFIILFTAIGFEFYFLVISAKKRAVRDVISGTYIKYQGVDYPF